MACYPIDVVVDGQRITGRVCMDRGRRRRTPCSVCGARVYEVECDGPPLPGSRRRSGTCDAKLCAACAVDAGENRHLCPPHGFAVEEVRCG